MKKSDFKIGWHGEDNWYVVVKETDNYLFRDGTVMNWYKILDKYDSKYVNGQTLFVSREEAEKCLDNYFRGENMNYEERIAQCDKDIAALNVERNELLKEKEKKNNPNYEIQQYINEHRVYNTYRDASITKNGDCYYVRVSLPNCNNTWTFAAFDWVKAFCERFNGVDRSVYPVHYCKAGFENSRFLYIKI